MIYLFCIILITLAIPCPPQGEELTSWALSICKDDQLCASRYSLGGGTNAFAYLFHLWVSAGNCTTTQPTNAELALAQMNGRAEQLCNPGERFVFSSDSMSGQCSCSHDQDCSLPEKGFIETLALVIACTALVLYILVKIYVDFARAHVYAAIIKGRKPLLDDI